jgi:plastocyanin
MPARTRTSLALLATAAALATACGNGTTTREPTGAFTVTLDDYLIRPQQIRVPKNEPLTVTVVNHGRLGHTFRLRSANHVVLKLTTIPPGGRAQRTFRLAAGSYTMFCALSNHEELGMHGTLVVG